MSAGHLRASDADRSQVADVLDTAYAEGRLTAAEHTDRIATALQGRTFDELRALTADLVPPPAPAPATAVRPLEPASDRLASVLASTKRVGSWRVSSSTANLVLLGDALLDLTQATLDSRTVEITCTQVLGSTKIRVPLGTTVRVEVTNVLAETSVKGIGEPDPAMPTVVLKGVNVLGEIVVRGPKKPPRWIRHVT